MRNDAESQRAGGERAVSGSGQAFNKSGSKRIEKEDKSWRRMLGEGGFVRMEDTGCVYMLKEIAGYTRGRNTN